jgi:hypothetical protein
MSLLTTHQASGARKPSLRSAGGLRIRHLSYETAEMRDAFAIHRFWAPLAIKDWRTYR